MARKTVPIALILERANHFLANSDDNQREQRLGVASFLETLLHSADAYAGFGYLPAAKSQTDIDGNGWNAEDDSRRNYYRKS